MGALEEKNKKVACKFYEFWNTGDRAIIEEIFAPDADMDNIPPGFGFGTGPEGFYNWATKGALKAIPDQKHTVAGVIAEKDNVAVWTTVKGTHSGDLLGMPPLGGRTLSQNVIMFFKIKNEKIVKVWTMVDISALEQLFKKDLSNYQSTPIKVGPF